MRTVLKHPTITPTVAELAAAFARRGVTVAFGHRAKIAKQFWRRSRSLVQCRGVGIVLVEQKLTVALEISGRVTITSHGKIVMKVRPTSYALVRMSGANGWRYDACA
ncbi:hypothetical protein [Bradyrhizobium sp. sGM-13]|uniref:hypothetical protein n=1 Tax=Bradyrhizobium sp. sGM-13 TaxID=2831781 RepID=UPI001BCCBB0A|nr:hypothetical protein [Bradyrhizobium sp. sGM-13]